LAVPVHATSGAQHADDLLFGKTFLNGVLLNVGSEELTIQLAKRFVSGQSGADGLAEKALGGLTPADYARQLAIEAVPVSFGFLSQVLLRTVGRRVSQSPKLD
jgi:hypothetical protein